MRIDHDRCLKSLYHKERQRINEAGYLFRISLTNFIYAAKHCDIDLDILCDPKKRIELELICETDDVFLRDNVRFVHKEYEDIDMPTQASVQPIKTNKRMTFLEFHHIKMQAARLTQHREDLRYPLMKVIRETKFDTDLYLELEESQKTDFGPIVEETQKKRGRPQKVTDEQIISFLADHYKSLPYIPKSVICENVGLKSGGTSHKRIELLIDSLQQH
jgi:hypothetical protein